MKTLIITAIVAASINAASASMVELDYRDGNVQTQICIEKPIKGTVGGFAYSCQKETWGEAYAGLTYCPTPNVQVALGAGQETGGNRVGGWVWAGKGKISAIHFFEDGASGPWAKTVVKYAITPKLSLGYVEKDFAGEGVYAEIKASKDITFKFSGFKKPELGLAFKF